MQHGLVRSEGMPVRSGKKKKGCVGQGKTRQSNVSLSRWELGERVLIVHGDEDGGERLRVCQLEEASPSLCAKYVGGIITDNGRTGGFEKLEIEKRFYAYGYRHITPIFPYCID